MTFKIIWESEYFMIESDVFDKVTPLRILEQLGMRGREVFISILVSHFGDEIDSYRRRLVRFEEAKRRGAIITDSIPHNRKSFYLRPGG